MQLNVLKDTLRKQLADGQTPSVLAYLQTVWAENSDMLSDTYLINAKLTKLENQNSMGIISHADYDLESNRITHAVLGFINELTENDLLKTGIPEFDRQPNTSEFYEKTPLNELEKLIYALKLAPLGKIKLVDCDRTAPYQEFVNAYKKLRKSPYQFYFVTAQSADQPANFTERIIYEIEAKTGTDIGQAIHFPRYDCKITGIPRVDFPFLPFDNWGDLSDNQLLFRKYFAERMQHFMTTNQSIEDFVGANTKRLPYRCFAFLFRIDFDEWGWTPELTEYLQWIIKTFKKNTSVDPLFSFQFVFVISSVKNNLNENPELKAGIIETLKETGIEPQTEGSPDAQKQLTVWYKNFMPVSKNDDLIRWFLKMTNDQLYNQIEEIIAVATRHLAQSDQLLMKDLEHLFRTTYNVSQRL